MHWHRYIRRYLFLKKDYKMDYQFFDNIILMNLFSFYSRVIEEENRGKIILFIYTHFRCFINFLHLLFVPWQTKCHFKNYAISLKKQNSSYSIIPFISIFPFDGGGSAVLQHCFWHTHFSLHRRWTSLENGIISWIEFFCNVSACGLIKLQRKL